MSSKEFTHIATQRITTGSHFQDVPGLLVYETPAFWVGENGRKYRKGGHYWESHGIPQHADGHDSSFTQLIDIVPVTEQTRRPIFASEAIRKEVMEFVSTLEQGLTEGSLGPLHSMGFSQCANVMKEKLFEMEKIND